MAFPAGKQAPPFAKAAGSGKFGKGKSKGKFGKRAPAQKALTAPRSLRGGGRY